MLTKNFDICADTLCSTDYSILSQWDRSSHELIIWRRVAYPASQVQVYIDDLTLTRQHHLEEIHHLTLDFQPHLVRFGCSSSDIEKKLHAIGISKQNPTLADIFPGQGNSYLVDDLEQRLSQDARTVFPGETDISVAIKTKTVNFNEPYHVDEIPVLGYCLDRFGTQFQIVNGNSTHMGKLEPGDVSIMKNKPHRTYGAKATRYRLWIGLFAPGYSRN